MADDPDWYTAVQDVKEAEAGPEAPPGPDVQQASVERPASVQQPSVTRPPLVRDSSVTPEPEAGPAWYDEAKTRPLLDRVASAAQGFGEATVSGTRALAANFPFPLGMAESIGDTLLSAANLERKKVYDEKGNLVGFEPSAVGKLADAIRGKQLEPSKDEEQEMGRWVGSVVPFVVGSVLAPEAETEATAPLLERLIPSKLSLAAGGATLSDSYKQLIAQGVTPDKALIYAGMHGLTDAALVQGMPQFLGIHDPEATKALEKAAEIASNGAIFEATQIVHNSISKLTDPEVEYLSGSNGAVGAGLLTSLVTQMVLSAGRQMARMTPRGGQEAPQRAEPILEPRGEARAENPAGGTPGTPTPEAEPVETRAGISQPRRSLSPQELAESYLEANRKAGADLSEAKVRRAETPLEKEESAYLKQKGLDVAYVDAGKTLPFPAVVSGGRMLFDANAPEGAKRWAILAHEVYHSIAGTEAGENIADLLKRVDPQGAEMAQADYERRFGKVMGEAPDRPAEEGTAHHLEQFATYLDIARRDPDRLKTIALRDPTVFEKIVDSVIGFANKFGANITPLAQRAAQRIHEELGASPFEARLEPARAARLALKLQDILNGVRVEQPSQEAAKAPASLPVGPAMEAGTVPVGVGSEAPEPPSEVGKPDFPNREVKPPGMAKSLKSRAKTTDLQQGGLFEKQAEKRDKGMFSIGGFHGTPHEFDPEEGEPLGRFRDEKIGTGEGAQAFGYGHYFTDSRDVADYYKMKLAREFPPRIDKSVDQKSDAAQIATRAVQLFGDKTEDAIRFADHSERYPPYEIGAQEEAAELLRSGKVKMAGRTYEAQLAPEPHELLDLGQPLSKQSAFVKEALNRIPESVWDSWASQTEDNPPNLAPEAYTGKQLVKGLERVMEDPAEASNVLRKAGIRGSVYESGTISGKGQGAKNYVIFDAADTKIKGRFAAPREELPPLAHARAEQLGQDVEQREERNPLGEARDVIKMTVGLDRMREEIGQPEHVSRAQQEAVAHEILRLDPKGEGVEKRLRSGKAVSGPDMIAAAKLINREALDGSAMRARNLANYLRDARATTARDLGLQLDKVSANWTPEQKLADILMQPSRMMRLRSESLERRLADPNLPAGRRTVLQGRLDNLNTIEAGKIEKARDALAKVGIDPHLIMDEDLNDPVRGARIARVVAIAKSMKGDKFANLQLADMLGPMSIGKKAISDTAHGAWLTHVNRLGEILVNQVVRDPNSAQAGEMKAMAKAYLPSLMQSSRYFLRALQTEMPVFEMDLKSKGVQTEKVGRGEFASRAPTVGGPIARALRLPSMTGMLAADEFARSNVMQLENQALAYRQAKAEGLKGDALTKRQAQIAADPENMLKGFAQAQKSGFQEKPGPIVSAVLRGRDFLDARSGGVPTGSILAPIVTIPGNIIKSGVSMTASPLTALVRMARGEYSGDKAAAVRDFGKALPVVAGTLGMLSLVFDEDKDGRPLITGAREAKAYELERAVPPMSIKFGDHYRSYAKIEPFATWLATVVDTAHTFKEASAKGNEQGATAALGAMVTSLREGLLEKPYMRTYGQLHDFFLSREQNASPAIKISNDIASRIVPNVLRTTMGAGEPDVRLREYASWGDIPHNLIGSVEPSNLRIAYDVWGRPVEKRDPGSSWGSALINDIANPLPIARSGDQANALDLLVMRYNDRVARGEIPGEEGEFKPTPPSPTIPRTKTRDRSRMTPDEYDEYQREAGAGAMRLLDNARLNYEQPGEEDIKTIKEAISKARTRARAGILQERENTPTVARK